MKVAVLVFALAVGGCAPLLAGSVVGAAVGPVVTPQVDRILNAVGLGFLDPGGVGAVKAVPAPK